MPLAPRDRGRSLPEEEHGDRREGRGAAREDFGESTSRTATARARAHYKRSIRRTCRRAVFKPEAERTPGETAARHAGATGGGGVIARRDRQADDARRSGAEEGSSRRRSRDREGAAGAAADGGDRHRRRLALPPIGAGDETSAARNAGSHRLTGPTARYLHDGPGSYEPPPSYFLIRGDPESQGSLMKPGFLQVALHGEHPTEIPRPDGRTSGRRLALASGSASPENPLTARVIVNRDLAPSLRPRHRGHARQLRQDGRAADSSGAARLAGGRVHEARLEHQAAAPADHDVRGLSDGVGLRSRRQS